MEDENKVVVRCPIAGHGPLCSKKECREEFEKDRWESCREILSDGVGRE